MSQIIYIVSPLIALLGGILGLLTFLKTRKIQNLQLEEIESKKRNKALEDEAFESLVKEAGIHYRSRYWDPSVGTEGFRIMERLVERGKMHRNDFGVFMLGPEPNSED